MVGGEDGGVTRDGSSHNLVIFPKDRAISEIPGDFSEIKVGWAKGRAEWR